MSRETSRMRSNMRPTLDEPKSANMTPSLVPPNNIKGISRQDQAQMYNSGGSTSHSTKIGSIRADRHPTS